MSSIETDDGGSEINGGEEVAGGFVVAGDDGTELLQPGDEVFAQVARLVDFPVIRAGIPAIPAGPSSVGQGCDRFHPTISRVQQSITHTR
ncbi:MAG TPA: hypothetical protein VNE63_16810 [Candidatus Acidoferrales bacterium]|nr:hypothetical protein [Candidatus Acidoferrales bacterium]